MINTIKKYQSTIIITLIIGLSFFLRVYHLDNLPYSLHDDEVMNGYVGRFILQNGYDIQGNKFPLIYFNNFGDYPNIFPMYLSGAFTYLFGVNAFAIRLPIAILGVLSVVLIYFFTQWLFNKQSIAYLSALFLAVCPWHIMLSRATAEGITASFIFMLGLFLLFKAIEKNKLSWSLLFAYLLIFATYLLYPGFRVLTPLVLLPTFLLTKNKILKKVLIGMTIFAFVLTLGISQTDWGRGRSSQLSIMAHNGTIAGKALNYSLALGPGRVLEARIFNNKYILATREFFRQYASYFSPQFLTGENYIQPKRYNLIEHSTSYWILLLVIASIIIIHFIKPFSQQQLLSIFQTNKVKFFFMLTWLLVVAPIPSALTMEEVPNIHRTIIMIFPLAIIFAVASYFLMTAKLFKHWQIIATALIFPILFIEVIYFWHTYTTLDYESNFVYRDDSKKLLANWLANNHKTYDRIFIPKSGNYLLHYLFFKGDFSSEYIGKFGLSFIIDHIENIYPVDDVCGAAVIYKTSNVNQKIVTINSEPCFTAQNVLFTTLEKIDRKNLTNAFVIQEPQLSAVTLGE